MDKTTSEPAAPELLTLTDAAVSPAGDPPYIGDEHWGRGGRFIYDPGTGRREPVPDEPETEE